jgi:hypothetical protein
MEIADRLSIRSAILADDKEYIASIFWATERIKVIQSIQNIIEGVE